MIIIVLILIRQRNLSAIKNCFYNNKLPSLLGHTVYLS